MNTAENSTITIEITGSTSGYISKEGQKKLQTEIGQLVLSHISDSLENGAVAEEGDGSNAAEETSEPEQVNSAEDKSEEIPVCDLSEEANDELGMNLLRIMGTDGMYDFEAYEAGVPLPEYSAKEIKRGVKSKKELSRIVVELVSHLNREQREKQALQKKVQEQERTIEEKDKIISEQAAELADKKSKAGHARNERFGRKSERRSTLDPELAEARKTSGDTGEVAADSSSASGGTEPDGSSGGETGEASEKQNDQKAENSGKSKDTRKKKNSGGKGKSGNSKSQKSSTGKDDGNTGAEEQPQPEEPVKRGWIVKRKKGCAEKVSENAISLTVVKHLSEDQLREAGEGGGKIKYLPNGRYEEAVFLNICVILNVEYERAINVKTKKIVSADSSHESKYLPGSNITRELLGRIVYMRVVLGLSVPRILKDLNTWGFRFTRQSLYRWFIQYALALIRPFVLRMLTKILETQKIQADETWTRIREDLKNNGRQNSVLWLIRTSEKLDVPAAVVVMYTGSRAEQELVQLIRGFSVKMMTDGYSAYSKLLSEFADQIELVGCLQHSRGRFADVIQSLKGERRYQKMTLEERAKLAPNQVLDLYDEVFRLEREMDDTLSLEDKKKYRMEVVKPALDKLFVRIESEQKKLSPAMSEYWRDAVNYAVNFKDRFYKAVEDPEMPLQNSACERTFAAFSVLRNNYKQLDTVNGAIALTSWFSVVQTANLDKADQQIYLLYLLEKLPDALKEHGDFYWYSQKDLKDIRKNGPKGYDDYGDLSYLDKYLPSGEDFAAYAAAYPQRNKDMLVWLARIIVDNEGTTNDEVSNAANVSNG